MRPQVPRSARDILNQSELIKYVLALLGERGYENLPLIRHGERQARIFFESRPRGGEDQRQETALLLYQGKCNKGRPGIVLRPLEGGVGVPTLFSFLQETLREAKGHLILNLTAYNAPPHTGGSLYGPCMWYELTPPSALRRLRFPEEKFWYTSPKWNEIILGPHRKVRDYLQRSSRGESLPPGKRPRPWPRTRKVLRRITHIGGFGL